MVFEKFMAIPNSRKSQVPLIQIDVNGELKWYLAYSLRKNFIKTVRNARVSIAKLGCFEGIYAQFVCDRIELLHRVGHFV